MPRSRSARRIFLRALPSFVLIVAGGSPLLADGKKRTPPPEKVELGLKNIPLMVGHAAKGVVLPNYDASGRLLGRFAAETAERIDDDHVRFSDLKILTFDEQEKPDFNIDMQQAVLNLDTRVIVSQTRTKVKRADFEITGDAMQFDTRTHQGSMHGSVHMTVFDPSTIGGKKPKP